MLSTIGGDVSVRSLGSLALASFILVAVFPRPTSQMDDSSGLLSETVCPSSNHSRASSAIVKDRAGLAAMLSLAAGARQGLQLQKLPYSELVTAFSQLDANATNLHHAFQSAIASAGVSLARKALYSASLALILGFSLPCVFLLMWWLLPKMCRLEEGDSWEGEGVDDDFYREQLDRTRTEQEKNMNFSAQLCGWFMAGIVVSVMVVLVVFVGVLLAGNQWVAEGVGSSSTAAQQVLPKLSELRAEAVQDINTTLMRQYESFKNSFQKKVESQVAEFRVDMPDKEREGKDLDDQVRENVITGQMERTKTYLEHIIGNWSQIKSFEEGIVDALHRAVAAAQVQCGLVLQSNASASSSPLHHQCMELEEHLPTLDTEGAGEVVQLLETGFLPVVRQIVSGHHPWVWHKVYREEVEQSMRQYLKEQFTERVVVMENGLVVVVAEVSAAYSTVDLHLPQSAEVVTEYMGERYLSGWEEMRFGSFIILALFLLALVLVTLVFTGRGLLCIFAMYRSGYDSGTASASTHSATVMKKSMWAAMAILVCLGVAIFVTLPVSSSLGAVCGPHGNFSAATDYLLDSPEVWSGGYPLGSLLLGNSSATLTLSSLLSTCIGGGSLYMAFQLQGNYPFHQIKVLQQEVNTLVEAIGLFGPPLPSVLSPNVSAGLKASLSLPLETHLSLLQDVNNSVFVNFSQSLDLLTNLTDNMMHHLGSLVTLRDAVSLVHALAEQTRLNRTAMIAPLKQMQREAYQAEQNIRNWQPSHRNYVKKENMLAGEVQTLFANTYREEVAPALVAVVQGEMGGLLQSVWTNVMCSVGECREAASLYGEFADGVCSDVLDGLDLIWSSCCAVFLTLIPLAVCTLLLSRRLSYPRSAQEDYSFNLAGTALGLTGSILWFAIVWTVDAWLLNALKNNSGFHSQLCASPSSGCCVQCVWIFALFFLSVSVVVALPCYLYQGYLVHRTLKCRIMRTRNYWLRRYKAVHFYCRLWTVVVLDVPFLIFACVFMGSVQHLQLSAVLALTLPVLGGMAFVLTCVRERNDVRAYWLWLRKEVELKSDWVRRLAATATPPPHPPSRCNDPAPSRGNADEYEMSSVQSVHDIGPPLGVGTSLPVLPPYTGHPFRTGLGRAERPSSLTAASDSEAETYTSVGTGQSHFNRPRRHPSSVAIMDELVDPNGSEMQQRKQEAHHDNGGVEVVEPELCDSSTLHSSSLPSIFDSSCAYGPSSQHPYTSADEMYASDTFSQDDGGTRSRMRRRYSFSGDMFVDI